VFGGIVEGRCQGQCEGPTRDDPITLCCREWTQVSLSEKRKRGKRKTRTKKKMNEKRKENENENERGIKKRNSLRYNIPI
jgi:hypothetical protein